MAGIEWHDDKCVNPVLHQLDQKIIYPHYDFKHLTEKYFEIGMKLDDFLIQLVKYCTQTVKVYDHDFNSFSEGVVIPHGIHDLKRNEGYITLGTSKDTSEFCCDCIKNWWENHSKEN